MGITWCFFVCFYFNCLRVKALFKKFTKIWGGFMNVFYFSAFDETKREMKAI